jgi:hypothetical protein
MTASLVTLSKPAKVKLLEGSEHNLRMIRRRIKLRQQVRSVWLPVNLTNHRQLTGVAVEVIDYLDGDVSDAIRGVVVVRDGTGQMKPHVLDN